jgi:hypothetical protein
LGQNPANLDHVGKAGWRGEAVFENHPLPVVRTDQVNRANGHGAGLRHWNVVEFQMESRILEDQLRFQNSRTQDFLPAVNVPDVGAKGFHTLQNTG